MEKLRIDRWSDWIDFTSGGIFAAIFGGDWTPHAFIDEKAWYGDKIAEMCCCYGAHYTNPTTELYVSMLLEFTGYEAAALFSTGSEATEAFWRACRVYYGKPCVWGGLVDPDEVGAEKTVSDAMHGMTLGAMIMAGKISYPGLGVFPELGAGRFGQAQDVTSCMIMEPYHAASAQFHRIEPTINRIKELQKTFPDIPLCVDEVQGGFGRTGKLFAHEWYENLDPDFVTIGKAMGGGLPLSALLGPGEIMNDPRVIEHAHLHSTHSGNPMMCAAGIEVIERIQRENLIEESHRKGLLVAELLKGCGVRFHAGRGLLAGLEFRDAEQADRVVMACREHGLLVVPTGRKWVKFGPPLTISDTELGDGIGILRAAIEEVLNADVETCGDSGEGSGASGEPVFEIGVQRLGESGDASSAENDGHGWEHG